MYNRALNFIHYKRTPQRKNGYQMKEAKKDWMTPIAKCEDAYLRCFCQVQEEGGLRRYRDNLLPEMHFHNGSLLEWTEECPPAQFWDQIREEIDLRRRQGATFCKLAADRIAPGMMEEIGEGGALQRFGYYLLSDHSTIKNWRRNHELDIRLTKTGEQVEDVIRVDEAYVGKAMMDAFHREKCLRRGQVYLASGGVDNYVAYDKGVPVGICDLFVDEGYAKIEDFVVAPSRQKQGVGTTLLAHVIEQALARGAEQIYLVTDEEDTAKDMYLRLGFEKVGESYAMLFLFDEKKGA